MAAAWAPDGSHALHGLDAGGGLVFTVALLSRGHAVATHPTRAEAVAFARRPGIFALILDCRTGALAGRLAPPPGLQFNGHGAFSPDGARLYTSEVVAEGSAGRIGIWDAANGYVRLGDMDSHGIGPHELRTRPDGAIIVANGGIQTDPHDRTSLNLDRMRPNLAVIGTEGGLLLMTELAPDLRRNSIRHLALLPGGVADICGVAAGTDAAFLLTDGAGAVWAGDKAGLRLRTRHDLSWDNHLVKIA